LEVEHHRETQIAECEWTAKDEAHFRSRTRETYRGWWVLENLPGGMRDMHWFDCYYVEITDPNARPEEVAARLQDATFWAHKGWAGYHDVEFHAAEEVEKEIAYWRGERDERRAYYGCENDAAPPCSGCCDREPNGETCTARLRRTMH
jgi:hypothetical protein